MQLYYVSVKLTVKSNDIYLFIFILNHYYSHLQYRYIEQKNKFSNWF